MTSTTVDPDHTTATAGASELADRYVSLWMEADPAVRRATIEEMWAAGGTHVLLDPSEEIRTAANAIGFPAPRLEARGHDELERRVATTYAELIAPGEMAFRSRGDARRAGDVVTFGWEMVHRHDATVLGAGREVLVLDDRGRIRADQQIIEG